MSASEKFKNTMDGGVKDARWDEYDELISSEVKNYNTRFKDTPKYVAVDWLEIKSMLWIESGGPDNASWTKRPMQIGNPGDPAYPKVLRGGKEGSDQIMETSLRHEVDAGNINNAKVNVKAGIAYLFARMAKFEIKSVPEPNDPIHEYVVKKHETLDAIASKHGTTIVELSTMNPKAVKMIHPGDKLTYHKAKMKRVIVGWRDFNHSQIAQRYNVGDTDYREKLDYVRELLKKSAPKESPK